MAHVLQVVIDDFKEVDDVLIIVFVAVEGLGAVVDVFLGAGSGQVDECTRQFLVDAGV